MKKQIFSAVIALCTAFSAQAKLYTVSSNITDYVVSIYTPTGDDLASGTPTSVAIGGTVDLDLDSSTQGYSINSANLSYNGFFQLDICSFDCIIRTTFDIQSNNYTPFVGAIFNSGTVVNDIDAQDGEGFFTYEVYDLSITPMRFDQVVVSVPLHGLILDNGTVNNGGDTITVNLPGTADVFSSIGALRFEGFETLQMTAGTITLTAVEAEADPSLLFDVDFSQPLHTAGQPPVIDSSTSTLSQIFMGEPMVEASFGPLVSQPLVFDSVHGGDIYEQVWFVTSSSADNITVTFDLATESYIGSTSDVRVFLDLPTAFRIDLTANGSISAVDVVTGISTPLGTFTDGELLQFRVDVDFPNGVMLISFNDSDPISVAHTGSHLESLRFNHAGTVSGSFGIDNILIRDTAGYADLTVDIVQIDKDTDQQLKYEVRVTNNGPELANNISYTHRYPWARETLGYWSFSEGSVAMTEGVCVTAPNPVDVVCSLPQLAAGDSWVQTVTATTIDNTKLSDLNATVSADEDDFDLFNNTASESFAAVTNPSADLIVVFTLINRSGVNGTFAYSITNDGPYTSEDVKFRITIPDGVNPSSVVIDGSEEAFCRNWSSSGTGLYLDCDLYNMAPGAIISITVSGTATSSVDMNSTTTGAVTSTETPDPNTGNTTAAGGCFIATVAFGDYHHSVLHLLRAFRDQVLMTNVVGTWFAEQYYNYSPAAAAWIGQHDTARAITRVALAPVIAVAWVSMQPLLVQLLILLTLVVAYRTGVKRLRQYREGKAQTPLILS